MAVTGTASVAATVAYGYAAGFVPGPVGFAVRGAGITASALFDGIALTAIGGSFTNRDMAVLSGTVVGTVVGGFAGWPGALAGYYAGGWLGGALHNIEPGSRDFSHLSNIGLAGGNPTDVRGTGLQRGPNNSGYGDALSRNPGTNPSIGYNRQEFDDLQKTIDIAIGPIGNLFTSYNHTPDVGESGYNGGLGSIGNFDGFSYGPGTRAHEEGLNDDVSFNGGGNRGGSSPGSVSVSHDNGSTGFTYGSGVYAGLGSGTTPLGGRVYSLEEGISPSAKRTLVHVTTGANLKVTDRLMRASGAKCIGGGYVV